MENHGAACSQTLKHHRSGTFRPWMAGWVACAAALAVSIILVSVMFGQTRQAPAKATARAEAGGSTAEVARGKYLVEGVAMCGQCHTPRDANGELDRSRWLQGAAVPWQPAQPRADWPLVAPRIGGNPPAEDADMITLLTTGVWNKGAPLRFPMMPFRMNEADAKAVVAYLKTVTPRN